MKILLTGGNGFFSSRFAEFYSGKYELLSLGKDQLDITDEARVLSIFMEFKPDYVIHAAAIAVTEFCNKYPEVARRINVEGTLNVARACKATGAKLVFLSTEQVFNGNIDKGPYDEKHKPVPDTVYGQNKLEAEGLLKNMLEELWILRFTWLFGLPRDSSEKVSSNIMWNTVESVLKGESILAPVNEYRGMTYVQELVEKFEGIFNIPYGTYHVGSMNNLSRYEVVKMIIEQMGIGGHRLNEFLQPDSEKYKENPRDVRLDTAKLAEQGIHFGSTQAGIKRCINEELKACLEGHGCKAAN